MCINFDKRKKVALPGDENQTIAFTVDYFTKIAKKSIDEKGKFFVAISGGNTPLKVYKQLSEECSTTIQWENVYIFWSDERGVSPNNKESNYKMAMDSGIRSLPLKKDHIFRMEAECNIEANAEKYETIIRNMLQDNKFDLIMLGIGVDGHIASLFPGTSALTVQDKFVVANYIPQKREYRMTFTYQLINSAKNIIIYVVGCDKNDIISKIFVNPLNTLPATKIGTNSNKALWIIDDSASKNNFL